MDEKILGFEEKLALLLAEARKKKNVLENREVLDFFSGETLDGDRMDKIYDFLEANKVDVLRRRWMQISSRKRRWIWIMRRRST